jgi:hypothetical protein
MIRRNPPKLATWLLQRLGAGRHSESLAGDLIEEYAQGQSRLWYWRQVALAIALARASAFRARPWIAVLRVFCRLAAELAIVLGVVSIIDQSRLPRDLQDMWSPAFIATIAVLIAIALAGILLSLKALQSKPPHLPINYLVVFFTVAALGAGTLTWASTTRRQCSAETCLCQKPEQRSVTDPGH